MHPARLLALVGLSAATLSIAPVAAAAPESANAPPADDNASADDNARYAWLDAQLTEIEASTERWYTGWTATFGWLALSQYSLGAAAPNAGLRAISLVGAVNSTLGLGAMLMAPNTLAHSAREHLKKDFDASTPLGRFERRRRAEYLLNATAAEEHFYHGPVPLVLAAVASGAGAFILIRGYDQVLGGWATLGAGVAVTALQMLTRPFSATSTWEKYQNRFHPTPTTQVPPSDQINLSFSVTPMGAAVTGTF